VIKFRTQKVEVGPILILHAAHDVSDPTIAKLAQAVERRLAAEVEPRHDFADAAAEVVDEYPLQIQPRTDPAEQAGW